MSTKTGFVRYNGSGYETATGQIISAFKPATTNNQVIDGFMKSSSKTAPKLTHQAAKSAQLHRRTEKTHTLARGGLKKPAKYASSRLHKLSPPSNFQREARAKTIQRHGRVNRFGGAARSALSAAQAAPKSLSGEIISRGRRTAHSSVNPVPAPAPSMITSVSHQKLERMLDEALVKADAHKAAMQYQAARHFWRRRWLSGPRRWVVMLVFFLALGSSIFIAWQKVPQLSLKAASLRVHFKAVAPSYKPEGYKVSGPAKASAGAVSLTYQSGVDGSSYVVSQSTSNLTSAMVANTVVPHGASVQTSEVDGNTVYIYGTDDNAAWVNNGVLYTIKNSANLNSDELIKIVKGINP